MKVNLTFEFTDDDRAALAHHYGHKLTHDDLRQWIMRNTRSTLEVICAEAPAEAARA